MKATSRIKTTTILWKFPKGGVNIFRNFETPGGLDLSKTVWNTMWDVFKKEKKQAGAELCQAQES